MKVIKRNGSEVEFDKSKIVRAITKANDSVSEADRIKAEQVAAIADAVEKKCHNLGREPTVEDIQDMVESQLVRVGSFPLAKHYITYRYTRSLARKSNTTDEKILSLIDCVNEEAKEENSNKNPVVNSTQRDYMAGEVSRDLTERVLLPKDIVDAHREGIIHFHDGDYFAQHSHNCFCSSTRFVSSRGVLAFSDCSDGEELLVLNKEGKWKKATVRKYERQAMRTVTLQSCRTVKTVKCTADHRWILNDGSVTTDLQVGDRLALLPECSDLHSINPDAFCLGFILGDGIDLTRGNGVSVRLCGTKMQYKDMFMRAGYRLSSQNLENGDCVLSLRNRVRKNEFINLHGWNYMSLTDKISLFKGYYAADGHTNCNSITTANEQLCQMIRDISALAGYHITSESKIIHDTNFKKGAVLYQFRFMQSQPANRAWIVKKIERDNHGSVYDTWCVEEPETHSFTLDGGIVTGNCDLVNLEDMLQNGTVITGTLIEKPHSFSTACNIATQIIAQVASNQYGGQSISLTHLAPFVQTSRLKIRKAVEEEMAGADITEEKKAEITEKRVREEITKGIQTIQYQVVTLLTTNGQAPFITVYMYLGETDDPQTKADLALIIEETLKQRYQGVKNESGVWVTPAFPKLIYVLEKDNITEGAPYWYLTELAAKCTARRMVPDYISEKMMLELKGDVDPCMGCRSFLTPDRFTDAGVGNIANAGNYEEGKHKYYGRFNQGVVTINLPDVALSSKGDKDLFWQIFDERLDLCYKALMCRHNRLKGTLSDAAPILWQYGACARLKKGEPIDKLLYNGYSTISLGYAGLYECVKYMTGKSHTDASATPFALSVMQHMNDACKKWKAETNIDFSLYGTPIESTTYKFAKCLQRRFGIIPGITDKGYITNSYHVHVTEPINAFDKLAFEAQFQALSPGGAISYVEVPDMQGNIEAVLEVIKFIYDHIIYAEMNTKSDYCQVCGWDGEIEIKDDNGKLVWTCPKCGNTDQSKMNVARRTCGYIGTQYWNQGRTQEIKERVLHL